MRARTAVLLFSALGAACGGGATAGGGAGGQRAPYPAGTALAVSGEPIPAALVEAAAQRVAEVYPERAASFHTTTALESFVLPRAALAQAHAEARAAARAACDAARERIRAGESAEALGAAELTGTWAQLSLLVWDAARRLEPGEWSEPLEGPGHFALVRLERRGGFEHFPAEEALTVRVLEFGYLPAGDAGPAWDAALGAARLEVVDPAYEELVPETLRYKMKGPKERRSTP